jgi:hypothetical protein
LELLDLATGLVGLQTELVHFLFTIAMLAWVDDKSTPPQRSLPFGVAWRGR